MVSGSPHILITLRTLFGDKLITPSQQNINDRRRFGNLNSGISPPDQTWDPVDLAAFDAMTDFNDVDFRQDSEESEQTIVPPSKTVSTFLRTQSHFPTSAHVIGAQAHIWPHNPHFQNPLCSLRVLPLYVQASEKEKQASKALPLAVWKAPSCLIFSLYCLYHTGPPGCLPTSNHISSSKETVPLIISLTILTETPRPKPRFPACFSRTQREARQRPRNAT